MSQATTVSKNNNAGSVPSVDYHTYDYASHHTAPFGPKGSGTHSTIEAFDREPQPEKRLALGYSTDSESESEQKHTAAMKAYLTTIEEHLPKHSNSSSSIKPTM